MCFATDPAARPTSYNGNQGAFNRLVGVRPVALAASQRGPGPCRLSGGRFHIETRDSILICRKRNPGRSVFLRRDRLGRFGTTSLIAVARHDVGRTGFARLGAAISGLGLYLFDSQPRPILLVG